MSKKKKATGVNENGNSLNEAAKKNKPAGDPWVQRLTAAVKERDQFKEQVEFAALRLKSVEQDLFHTMRDRDRYRAKYENLHRENTQIATQLNSARDLLDLTELQLKHFTDTLGTHRTLFLKTLNKSDEGQTNDRHETLA